MQFPDPEEIEFVLCAVEDELIPKNKSSVGHGFVGHDEHTEYFNDLYGDVLASCEDEELEEYELSKN